MLVLAQAVATAFYQGKSLRDYSLREGQNQFDPVGSTFSIYSCLRRAMAVPGAYRYGLSDYRYLAK
jgi:hypothetical protein